MKLTLEKDLKEKLLFVMNQDIRPLHKKRGLLNNIRNEYGLSEEEFMNIMLNMRKSEL